MKISAKWIALLVIALLLSLGAWRFVSTRAAAQAALQAQQDIQKQQNRLQLSVGDTVKVQQVELGAVLEISGPIRAANSAFLKARLPGELLALSVREGDFVKAGQILATVDSTEYQARLRQAQQQAESAKAQVDIARRSLDNNQALVTQGFISKTALDSSIATLAANEANYRAAQAGIDLARESVNNTVLRAPISGYVAQRLAQPGERVAVDARVVEIVDLSRLELEASLSPTDSLQVKVGQTATLTIEGAANTVQAKVVRVNPSASAGSRAVLAYLALAADPGVRQGLFAQGSLSTGSSSVLAVPLNAVRTDKPLPYVQLAVNGQVVHQPVTLGRKGVVGKQAMVEVGGVGIGAEVLTGGIGALREGTLLVRAPGTS